MSQTYIIAEMAYSHDGSVELARQIVTDASAAGADAVSIHFTHMPDYMVRHYGAGPGRVSAGKDTQPIYDYLVDISLSFEDWAEVVAHARQKGIDVLVMPNDPASLVFAETQKPDAYVLSAACFEEYEFVESVGRTGRPVYLRVGGATLGEIEKVINLLNQVECPSITLLYGHQNYPTGIEDTNLNFLTCLQNTFGLPVGIADHIDADDDFAGIAPLLALPLGISCIEKHLTYDRAKKGEDFESAFNVDELQLLIERVRKAEKAMGREHAVGLDASSSRYRNNVRKRLVASRSLKAGAVVKAQDVIAKRADEGLTASYKEHVIGRRLLKDLDFDDAVTFDVLGSREG